MTLLAEAFKSQNIEKVAGIEARGFVFGAAVADRLNAGFVPIRKRGKLPADTFSQSYDLEYGQDTLEIHRDAMGGGERTLLIDDLLATGGTALAAMALLKEVDAHLVSTAFVVELPALDGRKRLETAGADVFALLEFEGH